jgi:hypothetical protein
VPELIAAIEAANVTLESDTISLVAGTTYTLTEANNANHGPTGLPVIALGENLTIIGNGAVIERSTAGETPAFRLFDVAEGAALTLENLTLQGGLAFGAGAAASGGAIFSQGLLELTGVTVQKNQAVGSRGTNAFYYVSRGGDVVGFAGTVGAAAFGGGIYIAGGTALLTDVTLSSNTAQGGDGGDGLFVHVSKNSRIDGGGKIPSGNGGAGLGGGLYAAGGMVTLANTSVLSNKAQGGAAGQGIGGVAGQGYGGGLYIEADTAAFLDDLTIVKFKRNKASTSNPNVFGSYTAVI